MTFGSNDGVDTTASSRPVSTSITTMAAAECQRTARSAIFCSSRSIVVTMLCPGTGGSNLGAWMSAGLEGLDRAEVPGPIRWRTGDLVEVLLVVVDADLEPAQAPGLPLFACLQGNIMRKHGANRFDNSRCGGLNETS